MNLNRTIIIACVMLFSAATFSRAAAAASTDPTPVEMAPLKIPSSSTPQSDFPKRLDKACTGLLTLSLPADSSLRGLQGACSDIKTFQKLSDNDLVALRAFFDNPAAVEPLIASAVAAALKIALALPQAVVIPPPAPSSGSLESDIIQGLAQFVYDRAKAEATLYFTKQLSEKLCNGVHALFFPAVCVALAETTPSIPLGAMGTYLAAAARSDLKQLPDRSLAYAMHGLAADKTTEREALFGARIVLAYYQTVRSGRTPLDVARSLHAMQVPDTVVGRDTAVLKTSKVLSELLDSVQAQTDWTTITLPPGTPPTPIVTCYGLGAFFTFEKAYRADDNPFGEIPANKIAEMIPVFAGYLLDAAALVNRSKQAKSALSTTSAASSSGGFAIATPQGSATSSSGLTARDYVIVTTQTLEQALHAGVQIFDGLGIPISAQTKKTIDDVGAALEVGEQLARGQSPADVVILSAQLVEQLIATPAGSTPPRALGDIQQLLALIAQIADAKSADEVANVINAAAAPASTYELKYQSSMLSLGALAGAAAGYETLRTDGAGWSSGWVVGAFAPVGLTASTPLGSYFHADLMLSVINLGALVSARFSKDVKTTGTVASGTTMTTVASEPQVKLANVLAPGLFFALGLGKSPVVLSVGGQVIPIGREVSTVAPGGATSTSTTPAIQILAGLSIDVPILAF